MIKTCPKVFTVLCLTILLAACYDVSVNEPRAEPPHSDNRVPSVYLVSVNAQYTRQEITSLLARYGVSAIKQIDTYLYQVTLTRDPGQQRLQELAGESPMIRYIQPNNIYRKN